MSVAREELRTFREKVKKFESTLCARGAMINLSAAFKGHGCVGLWLVAPLWLAHAFVPPSPDGGGGGTLVNGSVAPVCAQESLCMIDSMSQALCLTPSGTWTPIHSSGSLFRIHVVNSKAYAIDENGALHVGELSRGLPQTSSDWTSVAMQGAGLLKFVAATSARIWGLARDGSLAYRSATTALDGPWTSAALPKTLHHIHASNSTLWGVDPDGKAWRMWDSEWEDVSGSYTGSFASVSAHRGHLFAVRQDGTALYRYTNESETPGKVWVDVPDGLDHNRDGFNNGVTDRQSSFEDCKSMCRARSDCTAAHYCAAGSGARTGECWLAKTWSSEGRSAGCAEVQNAYLTTETAGRWLPMPGLCEGAPLDYPIFTSRCGGHIGGPGVEDSFYVFVVGKGHGKLCYRFVYGVHPSAGEWHLLPQARERTWQLNM